MEKEDIKARLKWLRKQLGMTQEQFAEVLEIGQSTYAHIETGDRAGLTLAQAILLHEKLKVNPNWLLIGRGGVYLREEEKALPLVAEPAPVYRRMGKKNKKMDVEGEILAIKAFLKEKFPDF